MFKRIASIQILSGGAFLASFTYISLLASSVGMSKFQITIVASVYAIAAFISAYLFGRAADRYGRRKVLVIGLVSASLIALVQAIGWDFPSIAGSRFLAGIGLGTFPAALAVYAYDADIKMGRFFAFQSLGWGIALPISGLLAQTLSVRAVFVFASILLFSSFLIALTLPRVKEMVVKAPLVPIRMMIRNRGILIPLIVRHSTASAIWVLWPLFLRDRIGLGFAEIGLVQATNALTQFACFYLIGDKLPPRSSFIGGLLATSLAAASFTLVQTFPLFLLTQVALGISWSLMYIGALRMMMDRNRERATATGLLNSSVSLSALFGPIISIVIVAVLPSISYEGPMYLAAAASLIIGLPFVWTVAAERAKRRRDGAG